MSMKNFVYHNVIDIKIREYPYNPRNPRSHQIISEKHHFIA